MKPLFKGKKGNMGAKMLLFVILFNVIMYICIFNANADETVDTFGSGSASYDDLNSTTDENISVFNMKSFFSGFKVSILTDLPWWVDIFYATFQAVLFGLSIYMLIRGLS